MINKTSFKMLPNSNQSSNMAKKNSNLTIGEIWWFCFRKNGNIVTDYSWGHPTSPRTKKEAMVFIHSGPLKSYI